MNNLYELTAKELRDKFLSNELSAIEIVDSFYKRIEKVEDKIKSFVSLRKESALECLSAQMAISSSVSSSGQPQVLLQLTSLTVVSVKLSLTTSPAL